MSGYRDDLKEINDENFINFPALSYHCKKAIFDLINNGTPIDSIARDFNFSKENIINIYHKFLDQNLLDTPRIGGSQPRVSTPQMINSICKIKGLDPSIRGREIYSQLKKQFPDKTIPSVSTINRLIKRYFKSQDASENLSFETDPSQIPKSNQDADFFKNVGYDTFQSIPVPNFAGSAVLDKGQYSSLQNQNLYPKTFCFSSNLGKNYMSTDQKENEFVDYFNNKPPPIYQYQHIANNFMPTSILNQNTNTQNFSPRKLIFANQFDGVLNYSTLPQYTNFVPLYTQNTVMQEASNMYSFQNFNQKSFEPQNTDQQVDQVNINLEFEDLNEKNFTIED